MIELAKISLSQNEDGSIQSVHKETGIALSQLEYEELATQLKKGLRLSQHQAAKEEVLNCRYWWFWGKDTIKDAVGECVYFIDGKNDKPGLIKIGRSGQLNKRIKALRNDYGNSIEPILWIFVDNAYYAELFLHNKFAKYRVNGEWFRAEPVLKFLESYGEE